MQWFREYVYFPLGGSRCSRLCQARNTFVVFALSGLWHGAAWTFVAWGLFHACCFLPHIFSRAAEPQSPVQPSGHGWAERARGLLQVAVTFVLVCVGWVFFRSATLGEAFDHLRRMATDLHLHTPYGGLSTLCPVLFVVGVEWVMRHRRHGLDLAGRGLLRYRAARWAVYYALLFAVAYWGGAQSEFIYFQF